ncbi:hypothetical protein [Streptomyces sp. NPDC056660]|uniref:hypothetical protein n=1 Tax=Streptomyces sp. NPDC056660 TaxID=3345897 RepID=UPI0036CA67AF
MRVTASSRQHLVRAHALGGLQLAGIGVHGDDRGRRAERSHRLDGHLAQTADPDHHRGRARPQQVHRSLDGGCLTAEFLCPLFRLLMRSVASVMALPFRLLAKGPYQLQHMRQEAARWVAAQTVPRLVAFTEEPHHRPQRPLPQSTLPPRRNAATGGRGLDFAFDCAGVPIVREQAASVLGLNGSLILVGITPQPLTIGEGLAFDHLSKQVRPSASWCG